MISDPDEALDLVHRISRCNAGIARARLGLHKQKNKLRELLKERESLFDEATEEHPLFDGPPPVEEGAVDRGTVAPTDPIDGVIEQGKKDRKNRKKPSSKPEASAPQLA